MIFTIRLTTILIHTTIVIVNKRSFLDQLSRPLTTLMLMTLLLWLARWYRLLSMLQSQFHLFQSQFHLAYLLILLFQLPLHLSHLYLHSSLIIQLLSRSHHPHITIPLCKLCLNHYLCTIINPFSNKIRQLHCHLFHLLYLLLIFLQQLRLITKCLKHLLWLLDIYITN